MQELPQIYTKEHQLIFFEHQLARCNWHQDELAASKHHFGFDVSLLSSFSKIEINCCLLGNALSSK